MATRNKSRSDLEFYRGKVRELEKLVRSLQKELRNYRKRENEFENNKEELEALATLQANEEEFKSSLRKCQECFKGTLDEFNVFGNKYILTCIVCGKRHSEFR